MGANAAPLVVFTTQAVFTTKASAVDIATPSGEDCGNSRRERP
jgi:hypothetical protein